MAKWTSCEIRMLLFRGSNPSNLIRFFKYGFIFVTRRGVLRIGAEFR